MTDKVQELIEIDPELWLDYLLTHMADERKKQKLVADLAHQTDMTPDEVEAFMHSLAEMLFDAARSN